MEQFVRKEDKGARRSEEKQAEDGVGERRECIRERNEYENKKRN